MLNIRAIFHHLIKQQEKKCTENWVVCTLRQNRHLNPNHEKTYHFYNGNEVCQPSSTVNLFYIETALT